MKQTLSDAQQRQQALNPQASFIVQAPAGSGKTELLTQRFLQLLAHAEQKPEEILAITFTRKAAAEMHARIIKALQEARGPEPELAHQKANWLLAKKALARNDLLNWQLLDNPQRLQVQTIDSFCASLVRRMPILSGLGAQLTISDEPYALYGQAIERLFWDLDGKDAWQNSLCYLLSYLDNNLIKIKKMLINMLAARDHWLAHIMQNKNNMQLRNMLENNLQHVSKELICNLIKLFPKELTKEFNLLLNYCNQHINSKLEIKLNNLNEENLSQFKESWLLLADWLLTQEGEIFKSVSKKQGVPAPSSYKDKEDKQHAQEMKNRFLALLEQLKAHPEFVRCLHELRQAPPLIYTELQWQTLRALMEILPVAAAQLQLIFQEQQQVDFTEISLAALTALGSLEEPSDLSLALDYQLRHILVDEFQDTSITQYRLLEHLVADWQANGDRTLFLVGDPMQSIYRFRNAEVSLFLRAQQEGLANLHLTPLILTENFRSSATIVDWINLYFPHIFPAQSNLDSGAIHYTAAVAHNDNKKDSGVYVHALLDKQTEAEKIKIILSSLSGSTAILVRARTHLPTILTFLRNENIPYHAVDIDELYWRPVIQDLLALTKALLQTSDSTAWLALLRAPYCGLLLSDMHILASQRKELSIFKQLQNSELIKTLSHDGQQRLSFFTAVINKAWQERQRQTLHDWIRDIWLALNAPVCYADNNAMNDAETYFNFLDSVEVAGNIIEFDVLEAKLQKQFSRAPASQTNLQVLTIHKAKGLEFDNIILPSLESGSANDDSALFLWQERTREHQQIDLLLGPIKSAHEKSDALYQYLAQQNQLKQQQELRRLLYVAVTRAKKQLHLIGTAVLKEDKATAPKNSFLDFLWPAFNEAFSSSSSLTVKIETEKNIPLRQFKRLALQEFRQASFQAVPTAQFFDKKALLWQANAFTETGTIAHLILQQIAKDGLSKWPLEKLSEKSSAWKSLLSNRGVPIEQLEQAYRIVFKAIYNALNDEKGRWILSSHRESTTEFSMHEIQSDHSIKNFIADRSFLDENNDRWIIDYKITNQLIDNLEVFIEKQTELYTEQLMQYKKLFSQLYSERIRCALYFPVQGVFREI